VSHHAAARAHTGAPALPDDLRLNDSLCRPPITPRRSFVRVRRPYLACFSLSCLVFCGACAGLYAQSTPTPAEVFGFKDFSQQAAIDRKFLAVPDPKLLQDELKTLTASPHVAGSREDYETALYVRDKFKAAGLNTQIVEYLAWMNIPQGVYIEAKSADGTVLMTGPSREHVDHDPYQNDPRVLPPMNGSSPSGDVTADIVYANYGRPEDFKVLKDMHIDLRGKLVLVRYGGNFRGVKVYIAQQEGAAGVIMYSDPADDGYRRGKVYPDGPWRPETSVQRGAAQYLFKYPGDATTPGIASTPDLPAADRLALNRVTSLPTIPSLPISYHDALPILKNLGGPEAPHNWQGALPVTYRMGGTNSVKVHLQLKMNYTERPIWDVIGTIPGTQFPDDWVVAGNHRDAWVYGAVDPGSGTAAMLEVARGLGVLLSQGWKPKRTIYICSWDAEEEGLIGSTEWVEDHDRQLGNAVAYFNTDVAVSGSHFEASADPSLKQFIREISTEVPAPNGGTLYEAWKQEQKNPNKPHTGVAFNDTQTVSQIGSDVRVGDLGSGSDFTPFLQHLGVPSTDIGSVGPYGVYHSVFDNYAWFVMNADPTFAYEQEIARVFGLEVLHMADADVLPYDYVTYGQQILSYVNAAREHARKAGMRKLDFAPAKKAADRFETAARAVMNKQFSYSGDLAALNSALRQTEASLLNPQGLPGRSWYKHTIFAPGEYTGYAAVVIPGVNEAIDAADSTRAEEQLQALTAALNRAAVTLEAVR
jgi:N-acetylated-alpha-linked acidic dipeptidase